MARTKIQWIAATEVFLLLMMIGAGNGWISPFLAKLTRPDPPFQVTTEQISWVASIGTMTQWMGVVLGAIVSNYFGTKTSVYVCGFYFASAWISLICANSINIIYIQQFFFGISSGWLFTVFSMYLGEIVNANIRGTTISFAMNGLMIGMLYGNLMGAHAVPWIFGVVNLALTIIYLVTFYFFPSTPHFLISRNKLKEAEVSLKFYNDGADVKEEFNKLREFIDSSPRVPLRESFRRLRDPINLKTFIMINVVYSIVKFSGTYVLVEYIEIIMMAGRIEIISPTTLVSIMSAVALPASLIGVATSDTFGRVTLLFTSCMIFFVAFIGWGLSFHLLELGFSPSNVQWLVIVSALVYRVNMSAGLNPIVPVLISEIFAPNVKTLAAFLVNITCSLCMFISVKNFPYMVEYMTYKNLFYFYAGLVLAIGIYTKLYIPETKGKTLQEIQEMLLKNHSATNQTLTTEVIITKPSEHVALMQNKIIN